MARRTTKKTNKNRPQYSSLQSPSVRVGDEYQADLSELNCNDMVPDSSYVDRDERLWRPSSNISGAKLEKFLKRAKSQQDIEEDVALHILYRNGYSTDIAIENVKRLVKRKSSRLDLTIFKSGFQQCSNHFDLNKMRLMLPHRSTRRIVDMYCLIKGLTPYMLYSLDELNWNTKRKRDLSKPDQANVVRQLSMAKRKRTDVMVNACRLRSDSIATKEDPGLMENKNMQLYHTSAPLSII